MARHMRAPRRPQVSMLIAVVVFIVGLVLIGTSSAMPTSIGRPSVSSVASPLSTPTPTPTSTALTSPSVTPVATPVAPQVKPTDPPKKSFSAIGEPYEVEIPSAKFKYRVDALPAESISATNVINPPLDPNAVYLVEALREKDSQIDITGHSSSDGSKWPLNVISDASLVKLGDPVLLTSATGKHTYVISEINSLVRGDVAASKYQDPEREHRITFFTCDVLDLYERTRILVATRVS